MELTVLDRVAAGENLRVIEVVGEIDVYMAPRLRESIASVVEAGYRNLVIDLQDVGFLDSTGLGVLVGALKRVRASGGSLALVCSQERVLRVFSITGLDRVFRIADSFETL